MGCYAGVTAGREDYRQVTVTQVRLPSKSTRLPSASMANGAGEPSLTCGNSGSCVRCMSVRTMELALLRETRTLRVPPSARECATMTPLMSASGRARLRAGSYCH